MQHPRVFAESGLQSDVFGLKSDVRRLMSEVSEPDSRLATSDFRLPTSPSRPSRAKRHLPWEQIELESHGLYSEHLCTLAKRFPMLSPMELRICALIKGMLKSWEIAEKLNICEETVRNHRTNIRKKIKLKKGQELVAYLITEA